MMERGRRLDWWWFFCEGARDVEEKAGLVVGFGLTLKVCEGEREVREGEDKDEVR